MRPLRYKSRKSSTCNIRSSNFPLYPFLSTIRRSVRLSTLLAVAPSTSSVIDRIYTTFHASIILRPAAFLSNYSPCSYSFAEARATRRCIHYHRAPRLYKPPESPHLDIFIRHLQSFNSTCPVKHRVSPWLGAPHVYGKLTLASSFFSIILRPSTSTHKNR